MRYTESMQNSFRLPYMYNRDRLTADQKMKSNKEIIMKNRSKQQRIWKIQNNDRINTNNNIIIIDMIMLNINNNMCISIYIYI